MELKYGPWFKQIEMLAAIFNKRETSPVDRFAAMAAIKDAFQKEFQALEREIPRYQERAIEAISGKAG